MIFILFPLIPFYLIKNFILCASPFLRYGMQILEALLLVYVGDLRRKEPLSFIIKLVKICILSKEICEVSVFAVTYY
jgi:hypothetical protein